MRAGNACALTGLGGLLGSILGNAFGRTGLWVGGVVGGLVASFLVAWIARWRRWIPPESMLMTAFGTMVGFLLAAAIAVNTLSSPVGPVLSTTLAGFGALAGARLSKRSPSSDV
jgi:hypothetical protein